MCARTGFLYKLLADMVVVEAPPREAVNALAMEVAPLAAFNKIVTIDVLPVALVVVPPVRVLIPARRAASLVVALIAVGVLPVAAETTKADLGSALPPTTRLALVPTMQVAAADTPAKPVVVVPLLSLALPAPPGVAGASLAVLVVLPALAAIAALAVPGLAVEVTPAALSDRDGATLKVAIPAHWQITLVLCLDIVLKFVVIVVKILLVRVLLRGVQLLLKWRVACTQVVIPTQGICHHICVTLQRNHGIHGDGEEEKEHSESLTHIG